MLSQFDSGEGVCKEAIKRGILHFMVDLEGCSEMDSTFMGTLCGLALRVTELGEGSVTLLNAHPEVRKPLENLGIDGLFRM